MKISAVVFDFGGVMTTSTMPLRVMELAKKKGIDRDVFVRGFEKHRLLYDGDFITLREMYDAIWKDADLAVDDGTTELFMQEDTASWLFRRERTYEWMSGLKARGFKIGILTNMNSRFGDLHFKRAFADFIALADAMVISGEVRLYKPMREIYDLLRERIALPAGELCFIDDVEKNVEGARAAGWQAIRFITNEQTERDFENLLQSGHPYSILFSPAKNTAKSVLRGMLGSPSDADDVFQEAWLRVIKSRGAYRGGSVKAYLAKIARTAALDYLRKKGKYVLSIDGGDDVRDDLAWQEAPLAGM